ncbi:hypothetical protein OIV83_004809 [Microbotryomycetes sp. JL201]|nr:hypothetical protein OIV83_004809 [Microbotryomycetes sp. JL201]
MPESTRVIDTASGPVKGFRDTFPLQDKSPADEILDEGKDGGEDGVWKWLGVPYGRAERWKRVTAPEPWTEPRDCFEFGTKFPQPVGHSEKLYGHQPGFFARSWSQDSEDSFTVNVFAPENVKATDKLPVMFWIYGGSLNNGSACRFLYDPTEMTRASAKDGQPVIVVTGNYRTNIFGFFSGPDVFAADEEGLCGNYGLRDCVAMLEWTKANIGRFGGDAENVTIFGESAGGFLVSTLLVSGKKLFKRAIMQSGAAGTMRIKPVETAYPGYSEVFKLHGPSAATAEARINALRQVPWQELLETHIKSFGWGGLSLTLETGPNAIWNEDTVEKLEQGRWDPWIESVILGTTEDEGSLFAFGMQLNSPKGFEGYLKFLPSNIHDDIRAQYLPPGGHPEQVSIIDAPAAKVIADSLFVDPTYDQAVSLSKGDKCRVYLYRCRAIVDQMSKGALETGAMHTIEIPLVFNISSLWNRDPNVHEAKSSRVFRSAWTSFAATGQPSSDWKPFTEQEPTWFAVANGGVVANESLKGVAEKMLDWEGKGRKRSRNILSAVNE